MNDASKVRFESLYAEPSRNGLTKPKRVRGEGTKFINMGEIFAYDRIHNVPADRVPLTEKEEDSSMLINGDLLFARQSLVLSGAGKCSLFVGDDEPCTFESHLIRVRLNKDLVIPEYFFYYFKSPVGRWSIRSITEQGAGQSGIRGSDLKDLEVYLPSVQKQKAIAHILGTLDDKIELNRKMNETLEEMAQALFKSWFVDFEPVLDKALATDNEIPEPLRQKAQKRQQVPNEKKLLYTNPELVADFPDSFNFTDELGWIPEGWDALTIGSFGDVVGGGTPSTKIPEYFTDRGIPWLSPKDLSGYEWKFISRGENDISELGLQKSSAKLMPAGTVLFSSRAPIGYTAISRNLVSTNQGFKSIVPREGYLSEYVYHFLNWNKNQIEAVASGSTFKEVSGKVVKQFPALSPDDTVLVKFSELLESSSLKQIACQDSNATLTRLRDTLLPKLISGELQMPQAEKIIADHA